VFELFTETIRTVDQCIGMFNQPGYDLGKIFATYDLDDRLKVDAVRVALKNVFKT
jgi:hypothetical protein